MTDIDKWKAKIGAMGHAELARLYRFAPSGHLAFSESEIYTYFRDRFKSFDGMTTAVSKLIGWDQPKGEEIEALLLLHPHTR
jgi:hypothetical protein